MSRRALVTGASGGIGRQIALRLAAEGARVVLTGRSTDALASVGEEIEAGRRVRLGGPCADLREVGADRPTARGQGGPIDAARREQRHQRADARAWELSLEDWEETLRVNLTGVFLTARGR